jgi:hypothetical protein
MKDKDLEKIMQTWANHETGAAPEMRPTAEMYRAVRAKRKKTGFFAYRRWALVGAAAACLAVLAVSYTLFLRPSDVLDVSPFEETAFVGLRKGFPSDRGAAAEKRGGAPGKGEKKGPVVFRQLVLQFQRQDSQVIELIDLKGAQREPVVFTSADNYRLLLQPALDRHVYVFQLTASGVLVGLYPNEIYSSSSNPMLEGRTYHLPSEQNWLHLGKDKGEERLYIIASAHPMQDLTALYDGYKRGGDESSRREARENLLETLDNLEKARHGEASVWALSIDHR